MNPRALLLTCVSATLTLTTSAVVFLAWLGLDPDLRPFRRPLSGFRPAELHEMIQGQAHRPFVTRALLPLGVRAVRGILPQAATVRVTNALLRTRGLPRVVRSMGLAEEHVLDYAIAAALVYTCFVVFAFAQRDLFERLYSVPPAVHVVLPAVALVSLLPFFDVGSHHVYDPPTLALSALGLLTVAAGGTAFSVVFLLACVNRETALLLVAVFVILHPRRHRMAATCVAVWALVRGALAFAFRGNPGTLVELGLVENLRHAAAEPGLAPLFGLVLAAVVALRRRHEPLLARAALVMIPPLAAGYLAFGVWGEIRVFYEVVPVLLLWLVAGALAPTRWALRPRPARSTTDHGAAASWRPGPT